MTSTTISTRTSTSTATSPTLAAALAYACRGWHVFPLRPGTKRPAVPTHQAGACDRSDPRCAAGHTGWEQRATTDPDRITRAWTTTPELGVGIACGPSRLVVVDLDTPKPGTPRGTVLPPAWAEEPGVQDGADVLAVLAVRACQPWPTTWTVSTPSGGAHLYFTAPTTGHELGCTAGRLGPMIDTRAAGGYVVAPPTTTAPGAYAVLVDDDPEPLPPWLVTALTPPPRPARGTPPAPGTTTTTATGAADTSVPRYVAAAVRHEVGRVTHAPTGTRNQSLFTAALALGQLVGARALDADTVTHALLDAAADQIAAGAFSGAEAAATIASGLRRGIADPRTLPTTRPNGRSAA